MLLAVAASRPARGRRGRRRQGGHDDLDQHARRRPPPAAAPHHHAHHAHHHGAHHHRTAANPPRSPPRPAPPPHGAAPRAAFAASIETVTAADLYASWRPGCPVPVDPAAGHRPHHWGYDGASTSAANRRGRPAERDRRRLPRPLPGPVPDPAHAADRRVRRRRRRSIKANNTSGFNCRAVTGDNGWSEHAYGRAIDVNPFVNPYVKGGTVLPPRPRRTRTAGATTRG